MIPTCIAIRLTPVWICLLVHFADGKWPTPFQCLARVQDYGFSVSAFKRNPLVLVTHMFVHASDEHFVGNVMLLLCTLLELGEDCFQIGVADRGMWKSIKEAAGATAVLIIGGVSGVAGQLLFDYAQLKWKRWKGMFSVKSLIGFFHEEEEGIFSTLKSQFDSWVGSVTYSMGKHRVDTSFMCGASAGGYAIHGFGAAYRGTWITVWMAAALEVFKLATATLGGKPTSGSSGTGWGWWWGPGETVGHAAHLGGLGAGVLMGLGWRWWREHRRRHRFRRTLYT
ncbi:hypothetical protein, conserved [Trypanosoma brucei gambiense DAL972]|uniref:Peptidase S54 rhomboid domain-containing protein n=1 Tax=Trypanosoma brucei gambiense (strain MHOM/CI/86/DAL972) TaxID=679716 RepID=C9ZJ23_TRYB9|nr:hypothetical protein, conserved [Trypanosoma brucei gambiense DAL972]CBH09381.1 hypothetical protein, conserved [Trypanosoma brucei gambiense DAL972]|eukprot:XP_011771687.1 hypothetical protein, conserved [Trypanosoma brucei gambiense DAL972]